MWRMRQLKLHLRKTVIFIMSVTKSFGKFIIKMYKLHYILDRVSQNKTIIVCKRHTLNNYT